MRGPVGIVDVRRRLGEAGDVVFGGGWGGGLGGTNKQKQTKWAITVPVVTEEAGGGETGNGTVSHN